MERKKKRSCPKFLVSATFKSDTIWLFRKTNINKDHDIFSRCTFSSSSSEHVVSTWQTHVKSELCRITIYPNSVGTVKENKSIKDIGHKSCDFLLQPWSQKYIQHTQYSPQCSVLSCHQLEPAQMRHRCAETARKCERMTQCLYPSPNHLREEREYNIYSW